MEEQGAEDAHQASSEPHLFRKGGASVRKAKDGLTPDEQPSVSVSTPDQEKDSDASPAGDPDAEQVDGEHSAEDAEQSRHRLQRQKAQSRKTFRFRKSRRGPSKEEREPREQVEGQQSLESDETGGTRTSPPSLSPPAEQPAKAEPEPQADQL